jgi:TPR repeat
MKLRLTLGIIGCTLLTSLSSNILQAQAGDFGTNRQPRTCESTSTPQSGRISAAQAMTYAACEAETKRNNSSVRFIDILNLEVAPPHIAGNDEIRRYNEVNITNPVYKLRGSVVAYTCYSIGSLVHKSGENCTVTRIPQASGRCFRKTDGDWSCAIQTFTFPDTSEQHLPPPSETGAAAPATTELPEKIGNSSPSPVKVDLADYNNKIALAPQNAILYKDRGILKVDKFNDLNGALADYNKAIALDPKYAPSYFLRGHLKERLNDAKGAVADYNKAIALNVGKLDILYVIRGNLKRDKLNDVNGAIADYNKAIAFDPKSADAYLNRGLVYRRQGNKTLAIQDWRKAAKGYKHDKSGEDYDLVRKLLKELGAI